MSQSQSQLKILSCAVLKFAKAWSSGLPFNLPFRPFFRFSKHKLFSNQGFFDLDPRGGGGWALQEG